MIVTCRLWLFHGEQKRLKDPPLDTGDPLSIEGYRVRENIDWPVVASRGDIARDDRWESDTRRYRDS